MKVFGTRKWPIIAIFIEISEDAVSIQFSMELSSSSCEKQILHDVCDVCVDVARNQSSFSVKRPLLDLEPINETEQSSYCVQLMKRLNIQRQQIHFCNITLVAKEGREFKAHRNVLSAASPFFSKLLQSEMKTNKSIIGCFKKNTVFFLSGKMLYEQKKKKTWINI